jgi:hypothetical protein
MLIVKGSANILFPEFVLNRIMDEMATRVNRVKRQRLEIP